MIAPVGIADAAQQRDDAILREHIAVEWVHRGHGRCHFIIVEDIVESQSRRFRLGQSEHSDDR